MKGDDFSDYLLTKKKNLFLQVVVSATKKRGLPTPKVNFDGCASETKWQLAHYHPDTNVICVSREQLHMLNFDDIRQTATHEVAHILEHGHGGTFTAEHEGLKQLIWTPPAGVAHIRGGYERKEIPDKKKRKSKKTKPECSYHSCKVKTALSECKYCKRMFCQEHISAKVPSLPNFAATTSQEHLLLDEWRRSDAHPCIAYGDVWETEQKKEKEAYSNAFDVLVGRSTHIKETQYEHAGKGVGRKESITVDSSLADGKEDECSYHLCSAKGICYACKYCKKLFCKKHLSAKPPSILNIKAASHQELENWRREDAHPCIAYVETRKVEKEEENWAYTRALNRFKSAKKHHQDTNQSREVYNYSSRHNYGGEKDPSDSDESNLWKLIVVLVLLAVLYSMYVAGYFTRI